MITQAQKLVALEAIKQLSEEISNLAAGVVMPTGISYKASFDQLDLLKAFVESVGVASATKKALTLLKIDNNNCRVYYNGEHGHLYCFVMESNTSFALYLCTVSGEPSSPVDGAEYEIDYAPSSDSSVAMNFRAWHNKRSCA